jgi:hypothetical protein
VLRRGNDMKNIDARGKHGARWGAAPFLSGCVLWQCDGTCQLHAGGLSAMGP